MTVVSPGLVAYLTTNREFMAPAVADAITSLDLREGARILDVGTGGGGALPPLVTAAGSSGTVLAVDLDPGVIALARKHAELAGVGPRITFQVGDILEILAASAEKFDAIWASDVVWPGNFDDPRLAVATMAGALRAGGVLALFTSNYYQSTFLPGYSRLERTLHTASELRWKLPAGGPIQHDRHVAWLVAAGLHDVRCGCSHGSGSPPNPTRRCAPTLSRQSGPSCSSRHGCTGRTRAVGGRARARPAAADARQRRLCHGRTRLLRRAPDDPLVRAARRQLTASPGEHMVQQLGRRDALRAGLLTTAGLAAGPVLPASTSVPTWRTTRCASARGSGRLRRRPRCGDVADPRRERPGARRDLRATGRDPAGIPAEPGTSSVRRSACAHRVQARGRPAGDCRLGP